MSVQDVSTQHSPVGNFSKQAIRVKKIVLILCVAIVTIAFIAQHYLKPSQLAEEPIVTSSNTFFNRTAPTISKKNDVAQPVTVIDDSPLTVKEEERRLTDENARLDEKAQLEKMRMVAPSTVYSASGSQVSTVKNAAATNHPAPGDINSQFMNSMSQTATATVQAGRIAHPGSTLAQGKIIWATLESRIASDLPAMIRAVTTEDIYSEDGGRVLLPKGSTLIGQYLNAIAQGQSRVFAVWQRAIRPDHIDIQLNSYGTDPLGASGMAADHIDKHFFAQFGNAVLLSIISAGAANIGVSPDNQFNSVAAYREGIANSFSATAQKTLKDTGVIQPTLYIDQGAKISVFVARDLDFEVALQQQKAGS